MQRAVDAWCFEAVRVLRMAGARKRERKVRELGEWYPATVTKVEYDEARDERAVGRYKPDDGLEYVAKVVDQTRDKFALRWEGDDAEEEGVGRGRLERLGARSGLRVGDAVEVSDEALESVDCRRRGKEGEGRGGTWFQACCSSASGRWPVQGGARRGGATEKARRTARVRDAGLRRALRPARTSRGRRGVRAEHVRARRRRQAEGGRRGGAVRHSRRGNRWSP